MTDLQAEKKWLIYTQTIHIYRKLFFQDNYDKMETYVYKAV